jgi:GH18 family chitinase
MCLTKYLPLLLLIPSLQAQQWSVGYWTPWGSPALPPAAIEWGGVTHVVHAWALVNPDGTLDLTTQRVSTDGPVLIAAAHASGVKVLLGVAQMYWTGKTTYLQQAASANRTVLVNNIMNVVNTYGFDGVDIDWEPFSAGSNGPTMKLLAQDLRAQLGARSLSAAAIVTDYAYWGSVATYMDRIGVMTYDLTGTWNPYSWHNAALYDPDGMVWSVDLAVKRFTANGVPAAKLSIGIPFFGYRWTGGGITGPQQHWNSTPSVSQVYYNTFVSTINATNYRWDSQAKVPYLTGSSSFLTFDDETSIAEKVNYAKAKGLGGWIIWELSGGYLPAQTPNQPLLKAIQSAMGGSPTSPLITTTSPLPAGSVGAAYSLLLTASGTAPIVFSISAGSLPPGLALGTTGGDLTGTPTAAGNYAFTVQASNSTGSSTKLFNVAVNSAPLITTNSPLPPGILGAAYSLTMIAQGTAPITWSVISGSLPTGFTLNTTTGVMTGTPDVAGSFAFTVQALNAAGSNSKPYLLSIGTVPTITSLSPLPAVTVGSPYSYTVAAIGAAPITFNVISGSLPAGVLLNAATGLIAGTPAVVGSYTFLLQALNPYGIASKQFVLSVDPVPAPPPIIVSDGQQWSIGYWTPNGSPPIPPAAIEWAALTHVVYWSALVNANGSLDLATQALAANGASLISAAHGKGVKVLLGVAQPAQTTNLLQAASLNRAALVANIMNTVNAFGFDGVDLDWKPFTSGTDGTTMKLLAADLRAALGLKIMTAAAVVTDSAFWATTANPFHRINIQTYGLGGTWNPYSWHNSALYDSDGLVWSVNLAVQRFKAAGIPAGKLSIGIPFFGSRSVGGRLGSNSAQGITGPRQTWSTAPVLDGLPYQTLASLITSQNFRWDAAAQVPYLTIDNSGYSTDNFISYEDAQSVAAKVSYAKTNGLGGWIIWELSNGYLPTQTPNQPLLLAVINAPISVALVSPLGGTFNREEKVRMQAATSGPVVSVQYRVNGAAVSPVLSAPYVFDWIARPKGTHLVSAVAWDALGNAKTSVSITLTVR